MFSLSVKLVTTSKISIENEEAEIRLALVTCGVMVNTSSPSVMPSSIPFTKIVADVSPDLMVNESEKISLYTLVPKTTFVKVPKFSQFCSSLETNTLKDIVQLCPSPTISIRSKL